MTEQQLKADREAARLAELAARDNVKRYYNNKAKEKKQ